jgi:two-component system, cell cycle sensor histidine kinase and response regulator CckA
MDGIRETSRSEKRGGGDRTLLIVEDEHLMLRLLEKFFSRHGYQVLTASDGEQAIEVYHSCMRQIDAVLLDMRLPKGTGEEVFRAMKDENPAVKVVMASGFLEPETKIEMALAGAKQFVNKPYNLDELLEIFQSVIDSE